jgi:broad specificity phosphatase PhoE
MLFRGGVGHHRRVGRLLLIRHGQTDGPIGDRDRLSALGHAQAAAVGRVFEAAGTTFDRVATGPRRRHRETLAGARSAVFPAETVIDGLDEYPAELLFRDHLEAFAARDASLATLLASGIDDRDRMLYAALGPLGRAWARGEVGGEGLETWIAFEMRVKRAIDQLTADASRGLSVVAFTSAGVIAAATGLALGLPAEKAFDLSLVVRNASSTELLFSRGRLSLQTFNAPLATADASLLTHR